MTRRTACHTAIRILLLALCAMPCAIARAQERDSIVADSAMQHGGEAQKQGFMSRVLAVFDNYDTTYIEPNRYSWAFMVQNTTSFESYNISSRQDNIFHTFRPTPGFKTGPYFGWKFIFLGYAVDWTEIAGKTHNKKTEFELSLYTSRVGCDIIYRRTGDDYRMKTDDGFVDINGVVKVSVTGANMYYILNHRHFSYPAAMSQSTVQRRSAGSVMLGAGVTRHSLHFNIGGLPPGTGLVRPEVLGFDKLKYTDYSLSAGYGYNWVFKRNWLFSISAMPAIGYKRVSGDYSTKNAEENTAYDFFSRVGNNVNFDFTMRSAVVWNTGHYYGGVALVLHSYNHRQGNFSFHDTFGTVSAYVGLNFIKKKMPK